MGIEFWIAITVRLVGQVASSLLPDSPIEAIKQGVIGNRADDLAVAVARKSWQALKELRTSDPALNHDLQRAIRKAYLLATQELVRQAEDRMRRLRTVRRVLDESDEHDIQAMRKAVEKELNRLDQTLPEVDVRDADLLVLDEGTAPAARWAAMRLRQQETLKADVESWIGRPVWPKVLAELLANGWQIELSDKRIVERDWHALIAIAFVEQLKVEPRLRAVFEARVLAELKNREPALAPVSSFNGFEAIFDKLQPPLERIERGVEVIRTDVAAIRDGIEQISETLARTNASSSWTWGIVVGLLLIASVMFWLVRNRSVQQVQVPSAPVAAPSREGAPEQNRGTITPPTAAPRATVNQRSNNASPNVANIGGDVNITVGSQSKTGKPAPDNDSN
jgi:hypothetical protein